jgi:hypothetical protein
MISCNNNKIYYFHLFLVVCFVTSVLSLSSSEACDSTSYDDNNATLEQPVAVVSPSLPSKDDECLAATPPETQEELINFPYSSNHDEGVNRLLELANAQVKWLENDHHQGYVATDKMEIQPVDDISSSLGWFATTDISKNTVLMKIPRSSILSAGKC